MFKLPARIEPFKKPHQIDECLTVFDRNLCEAIVRHCAVVCERLAEQRYEHARMPYKVCAQSILREFGLEKK